MVPSAEVISKTYSVSVLVFILTLMSCIINGSSAYVWIPSENFMFKLPFANRSKSHSDGGYMVLSAVHSAVDCSICWYT